VRSKAAFSAVATGLLVALPLLSLAAGTAGAQNARAVNDYLEQVMGRWPAGEEIGVLVRFDGAPTVYDMGHLRDAGLTPRHTFHVLPIVYATGQVDAVWRASADPRVEWIEWNRPLTYMMENSTHAINATRVWNAVVEDGSSLQYPEIDGRGVTVVVVDSGVDAGHPDLKEKTIMNLKSDSNLAWYEIENSDTSSGHGTHVAGTVAGDGKASAGGRPGVALGANLIALSTGEAVAIINALGALEWVYDHSRPGNNPYNIRCATNSWGTSGAPYDPNDAIAIMTEKLTYENNVVVTFAAGNAGSNDHDGATLTTNPYANTPAAVSVAAYQRDGSGVTVFSSRGLKTDNATWPDIGAPGLRIESTRARLTLITAEVCISGGQCNPYYMAISGTSMATPHVAGEVALLFQAAPSLRVSEYHADFGSNSSQEDIDNWFTNPRTRMHEVEVILKLTADFLSPGEAMDGTDNYVPPYDNWTGFLGLQRDFAQGYGHTNMDRAVGLALVLQKLRSTDPEATVLDAWEQYTGLAVSRDKLFSAPTDTLVTGWTGVYSRYNDQFGRVILIQNSSKYVWIPNGTAEVNIDLNYVQLNADDRSYASVGWQVDFMDGSAPLTSGPFGGGGHVQATLTSSQFAGKTDRLWSFSVVGVGLRLQDLRPPFQFQELRVPYTYGLAIRVETSPDAPFLLEHVDYHAVEAQWRFPENGSVGSDGVILMTRPIFDISGVVPLSGRPQVPGGAGGFPIWAVALLLLVVLGAAAVLYNRERVKGGKAPIAAISMLDRYSLRVLAKARAAARRALALVRFGPKAARAASQPERPAGAAAAGTAGGGVGRILSRASAGVRKAGGSAAGLRGRLPFRRPGKV